MWMQKMFAPCEDSAAQKCLIFVKIWMHKNPSSLKKYGCAKMFAHPSVLLLRPVSPWPPSSSSPVFFSSLAGRLLEQHCPIARSCKKRSKSEVSEIKQLSGDKGNDKGSILYYMKGDQGLAVYYNKYEVEEL